MDEATPKPPDRSRRAVILATVGIVVIMGVAVFVGTFLVPFLQTRATLQECEIGYYKFRGGGISSVDFVWGWSGPRDHFRGPPEGEAAGVLEHLGGRGRAFRRLRTYLGMPRWAAPDRRVAVYLLGYCGEEAVPLLARTLDDLEGDVRMLAALALDRIGPGAEGIAPALRKAAEDEDMYVREAAANALAGIAPAPRETVHALERLLKDENEHVRRAAAAALKKIRGEGKEE